MAPKSPPSEGLNAAVAAVLRAERAALSMTLDDLAAASDISKMSVRRYLAAERYIDVEVLDSFARAFTTSPLELLERAQQRRLREQGKSDPG